MNLHFSSFFGSPPEPATPFFFAAKFLVSATHDSSSPKIWLHPLENLSAKKNVLPRSEAGVIYAVPEPTPAFPSVYPPSSRLYGGDNLLVQMAIVLDPRTHHLSSLPHLTVRCMVLKPHQRSQVSSVPSREHFRTLVRSREPMTLGCADFLVTRNTSRVDRLF